MAPLPPLDFGDEPKGQLPPLDFGDDATTALPPLDFGDSKTSPLTPLDFGDEQSTATPAQKPAEGQESGLLDDIKGGFVNAVRTPLDVLAEVPGVIRDYVTPSGQARLLNDPATAGVAGAAIGTASVLTGAGDSPVAETERENQHKANLGGYEYTPQGPMDPLAAEKLIGGGARIMAAGPAGALTVGGVESAAKAADIASHEPGQLGTVGGIARTAVAGLTAAVPMKAGAAIEQAVAAKGLTGAKAFIANALADAGVGTGAGTVQKATELLAAGVSPTSAEFWQGLKPTTEDVAMAVPGAIAAGFGGAQTSGARKALMDGEVLTPQRQADIQRSLEDEVAGLQSIRRDRANERMVRENAAERQRIADVEARAAQARDLVEQERAATNRVQEQQSLIEARRNIQSARQQAQADVEAADAAFRENPTPENADARVAAMDRVIELQRAPETLDMPPAQREEPLLLPTPDDMTAGEFPGKIVEPTQQKGGDPRELPTREGQGQEARRQIGLSPLARQSQAIEATPAEVDADIPLQGVRLGGERMKVYTVGDKGFHSLGEKFKAKSKSQNIEATPNTAGEGVINQRGEQVQMPGEAVGDSNAVKTIKKSITTSNDARHINVPKFTDRLRTELFDQFRPIQRLSQAAENLTGQKMKAADDPYKIFRGLNRNIISTVNRAMTTGLPRFGSYEPAAPSMRKILEPIKGNLEDFDALLAARRAPEMGNRQKSLPFDERTAMQATQEILKKPGMEQALNDYDKFTQAGLKYALDAGLYTPEEIKAIREANRLYAPWERVDEDGNIRLGTSPAPGRRPDQPGDPLKRVTKEGSQKNIVSPLETSIKNTVQLVAAAQKNAAKLKMVDVAGQSPELAGFAVPIDAEDIGRISPSKVITVKRNGQVEHYQVDPEIKKTLEGLTPEEADLTDKIMTGFANAFRGSVTLDPPFAVNNLFRDGWQQAIISRSAKVPIPLQNQVRGIGLLATRKGRDTWREWEQSAANQAIEYGAIMSRGQLLSDMARQARKTPNVIFDAKNINPANWPKMIAGTARLGLRGLNRTMQVAESFGRVGEYDRVKKQSLAKGFTDPEARAEAEFESVDLGDFSMKGRNRKIQTARQYIPFFGSTMSFSYREAGALKDPKVWLAAMTSLGGMEALNFYVNSDDPEYWNLPEDQRRRYWHWPTGNGKFVAIPKPVGIIGYLFTEPIRNMLDKHVAGSPEPSAMNFVRGLFDNLLPPGVPGPIKAAVETQLGEAGYSVFYDRPIVDQGLQRLPAEMQYSDRTSLTARKVGLGLGKLGVSASPQKIDYFIGSGMGSGIRRAVETVVDPAIAKVTGERIPGQPLGESLMKRNYFDPADKGSQAINEFYERLDRLEKAAAADKAGGEHEKYSKGELRRMRKKADRLADKRKQLQKYVGNEEKQREIKRAMVAEIRKNVDEDMPPAFQQYKR